jgi:hypothetical protein
MAFSPSAPMASSKSVMPNLAVVLITDPYILVLDHVRRDRHAPRAHWFTYTDVGGLDPPPRPSAPGRLLETSGLVMATRTVSSSYKAVADVAGLLVVEEKGRRGRGRARRSMLLWSVKKTGSRAAK